MNDFRKQHPFLFWFFIGIPLLFLANSAIGFAIRKLNPPTL